MSLTFYYAPMSTASITDLVLEEPGVPCDRVKLDSQKGDTKKPEYLAVNPNGKVPCIVHDGTAIWESAAITIYLGETFGVERGLFPTPGPRRGEAMKWIVWTNVTMGDAATRLGRAVEADRDYGIAESMWRYDTPEPALLARFLADHGRSPEEAVRLGWAHGALLTTFPGDTTMATLEEVRAFATGGSARIQR